MSNDSQEKESGEISDESFELKNITWKVDVLALPYLVEDQLLSPTFCFAGSIWKLAIYPYGQTKKNSEEYIDLYTGRVKFQSSNQKIFFKFCLITVHGKEFESCSSFTNFTPEFNVSGVTRYLKNSTIKRKKNFLAPKGVLSIMCQMRTKKVAVIDRCQIELISSFLVSPEEDSRTEPESSKISDCIGCDCGLRQSGPFFVNKTLRDLKELFLKQEDCDVIIKVREREFEAHKAILIARSPVFASTFRNDMKEKSTGVIDIEDCDPSSFSDFLYFLYCGTVEILTTENVYDLFTTADKYDVIDLRSECLEFMKRNLSVGNFCETVTLALQHLQKELIDLATDFFAKHLQDIIVTVKWQRFLIEYPVQSNEIMVKALVPKEKQEV